MQQITQPNFVNPSSQQVLWRKQGLWPQYRPDSFGANRNLLNNIGFKKLNPQEADKQSLKQVRKFRPLSTYILPYDAILWQGRHVKERDQKTPRDLFRCENETRPLFPYLLMQCFKLLS